MLVARGQSGALTRLEVAGQDVAVGEATAAADGDGEFVVNGLGLGVSTGDGVA